MKDFFGFRIMVTSAMIKVIYLTGVIALVVAGIIMLFDKDTLLTGLGLIVLGNLIWRIVCEGIILAFSIHETLVSIKDGLSKD